MAASVTQIYENELPKFDRVRNSSAKRATRKIDEKTKTSIQAIANRNDSEIRARIEELEREWDIDRALMAAFAVIGGSTFLAGLKVNRKWWRLFGVQLGFLFHHAVRGWCPPVAVLRRLGFRTTREIDAEKIALESLLKPQMA